MQISSIKQTCKDLPQQWEGFLKDGRMFCVDFRWGTLTIYISKRPTFDPMETLDNEVVSFEINEINQKEIIRIIENEDF